MSGQKATPKVSALRSRACRRGSSADRGSDSGRAGILTQWPFQAHRIGAYDLIPYARRRKFEVTALRIAGNSKRETGRAGWRRVLEQEALRLWAGEPQVGEVVT
jgi:hypothetical protein